MVNTTSTRKTNNNPNKKEEEPYIKDLNETPAEIKKKLKNIQRRIEHEELKEEMITERDTKNFVDWCLGRNYFFAYDDKSDPPGTESTDQMASEITSLIATRYLGTALGGLFISSGVLSWLGVLIIAYVNSPNSVITGLKKYIGAETMGLLPLDQIPIVSEVLAGYADQTNNRIEKKLSSYKKIKSKNIKYLKATEEELKKQLNGLKTDENLDKKGKLPEGEPLDKKENNPLKTEDSPYKGDEEDSDDDLKYQDNSDVEDIEDIQKFKFVDSKSDINSKANNNNNLKESLFPSILTDNLNQENDNKHTENLDNHRNNTNKSIVLDN